MMGARNDIAVIVPVYNGGAFLGQTLDALLASSRPADEIIVVDDGSTDQSPELALARGVRVVRQAARQGAAAARNAGAALSSSDIIIFVDADVRVHADALERLDTFLLQSPTVVAVFGSYDANPPSRSLVSWFRNMLHAYTHHMGQRDASTFWTGLGAVRRSAYERAGGIPLVETLEDVAFGARLKADGGAIALAPEIQGAHLKTWTLISMVRTDIWGRGVPWMQMALAGLGLKNDLNTKLDQRLSVAIAGLAPLLSMYLLVAQSLLGLAALVGMIASYMLLNRGLLTFLARHGGLARAIGSIPFLWVYHVCCGVSVILGLAAHFIARKPAPFHLSVAD